MGWIIRKALRNRNTMVWIISRNLCEVTRWCECFSQRWYGAYKEWKKGGWIMNKHQFNVEIQYSQNTLTHTKNTVIFYNFCLFHSVCVCVFLFNSYHLTNMCPKCDATTNSMGYSFFFFKRQRYNKEVYRICK